MKGIYGLPVFVLFILCLSCGTAKNTTSIDSLPATVLQPFGRYRITANQDLELISSAVHFSFSFKGRECRVYAFLNDSTAHNYLQYEMDGAYQKRIRLDGSDKQPIVLMATSEGQHTVHVYKATEAHTGPVFIRKIEGKALKVLPIPTAPLIEFIGNSITCAAAADPSEVPCGQGVYHDQHNAYYSYATRVARALGTSYILSSVSGIGIYRNWNSDGPTMPQVYENTDFQLGSADRWNFATYTPAIVSIALGTNDFSGGDGIRKRLPFDSAAFVSQYIPFVQLVKSKYPNAQLVLLSSPMVGAGRGQLLQNCLKAVKEKTDVQYPKDKPVALYFFRPMHPRGCGGHPSVEDHAILAEELIPFFRNLLE